MGGYFVYALKLSSSHIKLNLFLPPNNFTVKSSFMIQAVYNIQSTNMHSNTKKIVDRINFLIELLYKQKRSQNEK